MPIEPRPQKIIADQLHDLANRVSDMETATDATQQADHYADLAAEISHRLETLQAELANEISSFKSSTALPNHHIFLLTEMLERSKVSDPPTPQLRDLDDAPSAFKIAAQPETDADFRQRLIDHVISPSVQDCEDMGWVTGAALDAIGLKYGLKRRVLSSGTEESAPTPVPISEMHLHFYPPVGSVLNAVGNIVQIEPGAPPDARKDSWPAEGGPLDGTNITTEWVNYLFLVDRPPVEPNDAVAWFRSTYQRYVTISDRFVWRFISTQPFDCYGRPVEK